MNFECSYSKGCKFSCMSFEGAWSAWVGSREWGKGLEPSGYSKSDFRHVDLKRKAGVLVWGQWGHFGKEAVQSMTYHMELSIAYAQCAWLQVTTASRTQKEVLRCQTRKSMLGNACMLV
jgi:hypothetical protein